MTPNNDDALVEAALRAQSVESIPSHREGRAQIRLNFKRDSDRQAYLDAFVDAHQRALTAHRNYKGE